VNKKINFKLIAWYAVLGALIFWSFAPPKAPPELKYTTFLEEVEKGNVAEVVELRESRVLVVTLKNERTADAAVKGEAAAERHKVFRVMKSSDGLAMLLKDKKVTLQSVDGKPGFFSNLAWFMLPMLLILVLWFFIMKRQQGTMGGGLKGMFGFGKHHAKFIPASDQTNKVTFADVAGVEEAKEELREVVDFLRNPAKYDYLGGKIPKGVFLSGPPGTGKTLLARAVAGEAGCNFFSISGSDFVEMFVGVGASRVRSLFEDAKKFAPSIIFFDEIDAVGRHRGTGLGGGHDEREQTLNQLLVEMDGFEANSGVIVIAASNREDVLDPALLRSGRFDRRVVVGLPDLQAREKILGIHAKTRKFAPEVNMLQIAKGTPGFTGADLANLINEAALLAARGNKQLIELVDLEAAKDKIFEGPERKSFVMLPKDREIIASHEAGHAVVADYLYKQEPDDADPVHKVTIIPRGRSLGSTHQLPEIDHIQYSKKQILNKIATLLGGRVAEAIRAEKTQKLHAITTGAGNDLERATDIVRKMICEWGFYAEEFGLRTFGSASGNPFIGRDFAHERNYSEAQAAEIDGKIKVILQDCEKLARSILVERADTHANLAIALLERESLTGDDLKLCLA